MDKLIWFVVVFLLIYLFYLFFVILRKKKLSKFKSGVEVTILGKKYKVDVDKIGIKKIAHVVALTNALIIAITFVIIDFFNNIIIKLMMSFVVLMVLIFISYSIIGRILRKKEKNV